MRPVSPLSLEREGGFLAPPKATFRCARACRRYVEPQRRSGAVALPAQNPVGAGG